MSEIRVGDVRTCRVTGKKSLVTDFNGAEVRVQAFNRLERLNPGDPADGRWAPFVPAKEAAHGWMPLARFIVETF